MRDRWRVLGLATVAFNFAFLVWFSFAPFVGSIAREFALSDPAIGILLSAAVWTVPVGRVLVGWLTDRYGPTVMFSGILLLAGVASIASALAQSYAVFFGSRLVAATVGSSFVIGIKHIAEHFPAAQLGTAEGIYAGLGNAGAGLSALLLPRFFGADWRAAFLATGLGAIAVAGLYLLLGDRSMPAAQDRSSVDDWLWTATRYGTVTLAIAYVMFFGLELAMDSWLPYYFERTFGVPQVLAGAFAASFPIVAGLARPFGGYVSDRLVRRERNLFPLFVGRYRVQWLLCCLTTVAVGLLGLFVAGVAGSVALTVLTGALLGVGCGFGGGAVFALVPTMFPDNSGSAAGIVGGFGTFGGVVFPLVLSWAATIGDPAMGYVLIGMLTLPTAILISSVCYRTASFGAEDGFTTSE